MTADNSVAPERTFSQADVDQIVGDRLARDRKTRVVSEERVYGLDSPHSYFQDTMAVAMDPSGTTHPSAHERLHRYSVELAHEIDRGTPEGRTALRIIREQSRVEDAIEHEKRENGWLREVRALLTGGGTTAAVGTSLSAFVAPYFLLSEWALFRGSHRTFADQCHNLPLPAYGMQIYIPAFTTTDQVAVQTEGAAVAETDPTGSLQGGAVVNISGQITLSQQFDDRAFTGGGSMDVLINRQLQQQLDERVDIYTIQQVISNSGPTTVGAATWTDLSTLYADIAKAREQLTDTAGVRLRPTHVFTTSDFYSYVSRQVTAGRPVMVPGFVPGFPIATGADDGQNNSSREAWSRFTGSVLPGGVLWFTDDNIPASGANAQIIVSAPDQAVLLLEQPNPILSVFPQTIANQLEIVLNLRKYVSVITRHASGSQVFTGNAYGPNLI